MDLSKKKNNKCVIIISMNIMTTNLKVGSNSNIKTTTTRVLIAILLIEALVWAGSILFEQPSSSSMFSVGISLTTKFNLTFWALAGVLISCILAFRCMEKEEGLPKIMAIVGLASCAIGVVLQLAMIWELVGFIESNGMFSIGITIMGKFMLAAMTTTAAAIGGALVMRIEENGDSITPLKYTALICGICFWLVTVFIIFADASNAGTLLTKGLPLSGVMLAAFVVTCISAILLSWFNRRDKIEMALAHADEIGSKDTNTSADFDKIIETSVEERIAKKEALEATPPLQDEEMAPVVARDNEIKSAVPVDLAAPEVPVADEAVATPVTSEASAAPVDLSAPMTPEASAAPVTSEASAAPVDLSAPGIAADPVVSAAPVANQAEKKEAKKELPPLQDESMSPTVVHENGPKIQPNGGTSGLSGGAA